MPVDDVTPAIAVSGQGTRRAGASPSRVREPSSTPVLRRAAGSRAGSAPSNDARTWLIPIVSSAALHKGSVRVVGRKSPRSLYSLAHVTFEADQVYDQRDAAGFIKLNALRLRVLATRDKRVKG